MKEERKNQIATMRDLCLASPLKSRSVVLGPMLDDCLKHIAKLERENLSLKKIDDIRRLADEREQEILRGIVSTGTKPKTRTMCADCGKPAGEIHNCKEQARANRKARRARK